MLRRRIERFASPAWVCAAALALLALALPAAAREVPALTGRVVDQAGLLDGDQRVALEQKLADFEQKTGIQVAVLTVESLEGETIEAFSMHVAESWKLGQKEKDNGVLFTIAKNDRKMRIEVGYGLESKLTDLASGHILDNVRTSFRAGDFPGGISGGVDSIRGTLEGTPDAIPAAAPKWRYTLGPLGPRLIAFAFYLLVTGVFSAVGLFSKGGEAWFLYFFLMPFHLLFPLVLHPLAGPAMFGLWLIGFPLFRLWRKATGRIDRFFPRFDPSSWRSVSGSGGGSSWSSGSSSSSSSYSSGGGSSFSGGGGSFGGGGSSSSW